MYMYTNTVAITTLYMYSEIPRCGQIWNKDTSKICTLSCLPKKMAYSGEFHTKPTPEMRTGRLVPMVSGEKGLNCTCIQCVHVHTVFDRNVALYL